MCNGGEVGVYCWGYSTNNKLYMSAGMKWIVALIVIVIAGIGLWKSGLISLSAPSPLTNQEATSTPQAQSGLPTAQSDTSDAAVTQDAAAIDAQLQGLNQDQAAVNSSLSDQPVQQSY